MKAIFPLLMPNIVPESPKTEVEAPLFKYQAGEKHLCFGAVLDAYLAQGLIESEGEILETDEEKEDQADLLIPDAGRCSAALFAVIPVPSEPVSSGETEVRVELNGIQTGPVQTGPEIAEEPAVNELPGPPLEREGSIPFEGEGSVPLEEMNPAAAKTAKREAAPLNGVQDWPPGLEAGGADQKKTLPVEQEIVFQVLPEDRQEEPLRAEPAAAQDFPGAEGAAPASSREIAEEAHSFLPAAEEGQAGGQVFNSTPTPAEQAERLGVPNPAREVHEIRANSLHLKGFSAAKQPVRSPIKQALPEQSVLELEADKEPVPSAKGEPALTAFEEKIVKMEVESAKMPVNAVPLGEKPKGFKAEAESSAAQSPLADGVNEEQALNAEKPAVLKHANVLGPEPQQEQYEAAGPKESGFEAPADAAAPTAVQGPEHTAAQKKEKSGDLSKSIANLLKPQLNSTGPRIAEPSQSAAAKARAVLDLLENENVLPKLTQQIRMLVQEERSEVRIQLKPEHLGEMKIKLSLERGIMTTEFVVENEAVRKIIQSRLPELQTALQEQGTNTAEMTVNIGFAQERKEDSPAFRRQQFGSAGSSVRGRPVQAEKKSYLGPDPWYRIDLRA